METQNESSDLEEKAEDKKTEEPGSESSTKAEEVIDEKPADDAGFKTPSFVITSKKRVQNGAEASSVFKPLEKPSIKSSSQENSQAEPESRKVSPLSPAEQLGHAKAAIPYKEPPWSSLCEQKYAFEVIKNGAVIDKIDLTTKPFYVIGRIPSCDIPMEHPSLSRYHAVIQFSNGSSEEQPKGWYLYDLDSTHGTWINKNKAPSGRFHRIHVDYVLKFGGSTRLFIMQGPDADRQEESELSVSEMKEQREKQLKEAELIRLAEIEEAERKAEMLKRKDEEKGCSWGIDEDAEVEDEEGEENPFSNLAQENEQLYIDDPKKSLNGYFEREGYDPPEYDFTESGFGKWKCSVELPLDTPSGEPMRAEVVVSGKKKDAVVACALEACRMLDRLGELRKSTHESRKKKQKNWEDDDFYDSDEDVYLDRTGTIEKKREYRKMKVGKVEQASDTYDSLLEKHKSVVAEINELSDKLEKAKAQAAAMESEDIDALDAYMSAIKSGMMDTKTKMKLKRQLMELKQEEQKLRRLLNVAKPASMPELVQKERHEVAKSSIKSGVGKMKGLAIGKVFKKTTEKVLVDEAPVSKADDVVEEEEEEEDDQHKNVSRKVEEKVTQEDEVSSSQTIKSHSAHSLKLPAKQDYDSVTKASVKQPTRNTKGPSMPLAAVLQQLQSEADSMDMESGDFPDEGTDTGSSIKRKVTNKVDSGKKRKLETLDSADPDYASWIPPDSQSGDGKTHLNEKYGY